MKTCDSSAHSTDKEISVSDPISIQFTRFSAFYSPLIATMAGGFLADEGFEPRHSVAPAGKSAIEGVVNGGVHVCQSAPSQGFGALEKGQAPPVVHFAQINEKDGFFLTGRDADPAFTWQKLAGKKVLVDHGGQPLAMFKYACHRRGLDYKAIHALDVPSGRMDAAFRKGEGDYIHQQGPAPQQLEHDKAGHVVASVGDAIGPCAFSSLAATREWLGTDAAKRFMRAYRKARAWLLATPAARVADAEASFFPDSDRAVLTATITAYQKLGCWTPHVEITRPAFEGALDVFQHAGLITKRHRYEDVVAPPPGAA
jgi:NitT/TauT family transport system substrate-binding protein